MPAVMGPHEDWPSRAQHIQRPQGCHGTRVGVPRGTQGRTNATHSRAGENVWQRERLRHTPEGQHASATQLHQSPHSARILPGLRANTMGFHRQGHTEGRSPTVKRGSDTTADATLLHSEHTLRVPEGDDRQSQPGQRDTGPPVGPGPQLGSSPGRLSPTCCTCISVMATFQAQVVTH